MGFLIPSHWFLSITVGTSLWLNAVCLGIHCTVFSSFTIGKRQTSPPIFYYLREAVKKIVVPIFVDQDERHL